MTEEDAPVIVGWRNSPHIASMSIASSRADLTLEQHLDWFKRSRSGRVDYVIELKKDQKPIGSVSFVWLNFCDYENCAESGKYIGDLSALGKGYAYEAATCWFAYAFNNLGLDCVVERTRCTNVANIRINEKLGLKIFPWPREFGPSSDDWIFMRITRSDWIGRLASY